MSTIRQLLRSALLAIGLLLLAAAAASAHSGHDHAGAVPDSGRGGELGVLRLDHGDDFAAARSVERWFLETGVGRFRLEVSGTLGAEPGVLVRVHGQRVGNTITVSRTSAGLAAIETVETAATAAASESAAAPPPAVTKRVAVLLVNFTNNTSQPFSVGSAQSVLASVGGFYAEGSYGAMTLTGDVFGWWTINDTDAGCDYNNWGTLARQRAAAEGISLSGYTNVVTAFPSVGCGWSGLAQVPGSYSWLQGTGGMSTRVMGHELGHNFGDHHAQSMTCTDAGGTRVVYSSTCTVSEYGDPFDIMGSSTRLQWAWHRKQAGIMLSTDIQTVTSGTYTFGAVSLVDSNPKAIRVLQPGTSNYWYVEYRIRYGTYDNYTAGAQPTTGVLIRQAPNSSRVQSQLLDANPATSTFNDAAFVPGTSFVDAIHNVTIRVDSITATTATITVNPPPAGDTQPPTTPGSFTASEASSSSILLTWTASTDNVGVTGYEIRRDGVLIATPSGSATSYLDTGRTAGVTYGYSILARDAAGNTSGTATTSGQIALPPPDTQPPTTPGSFSAAEASASSILLTWTASTDNVGVTGYEIRRNGALIASPSGSATSYLDTGRTAGVTYTYTILARDAAGNTSGTATTTGQIAPPPPGDSQPPTAPANLRVSSQTGANVVLAWDASTDNVGVSGYRVYVDGALTATTTSTSVTIKPSKGSHSVHVVAYDAAGNVSAASNSITVTR